MKCAAPPREYLDVNLVRRCRGAPLPCGDELRMAFLIFLRGAEGAGFGAEEGWAGAVDGLAVDRQPLAHLMKPLDLGCWHNAFGVRPDVKQIVTALAGDIDEIA